MCTDIKNILDILDIILKWVVSVGVFGVGYLAYKINEGKLKLDLYNRRFNVYISAVEYYLATNADKDTQQQARLNFTKHFRESVFLFGKDSEVYSLLQEFMQEMNNPTRHSLKAEDYLIRLENALAPWLDFKNISKT